MISEIMERKRDIRRLLLKKRNSLTEEQREQYDKLIAEQLFTFTQYVKADTILIYASYQSEVSTYPIIKYALNTDKKIFCPKVLGPGVMEFYEITSLKDVVCGYKNIPEPKYVNNPYLNIENSNPLMLMPLVGFDHNKNRLGYGGGFYDRYLQKFPNIYKIALGYECQKYEMILPTEDTDIKPDRIITERMLY